MSNETPQSPSPFNTWWFAAGALLAVVVVALVAVLWFGRGGTEAAAPATETAVAAAPTSGAPVAPSTTPATTAAPVDDGACSLPAGDQDIPTSSPDATWKNKQYLLLPYSSEYGPSSLPGSTWSCFAHSPTGALFAAAHFASILGDPDYKQFADDAAVNNAARSSWIASQDPAGHNQTAGDVAQIGGYQFQSVDPDAVVVKIGFVQGDIQGDLTVSLKWDAEADTWKTDIATSNLAFETADLSSFTAWAAQ